MYLTDITASYGSHFRRPISDVLGYYTELRACKDLIEIQPAYVLEYCY